MQLVEQTTKSSNISLIDCANVIHQINCHPRKICELIAQFSVFKQCKIYSVMADFNNQHDNGSFGDIIGQFNAQTTWCNYPIAKGDVVIISKQTKKVAFFDGGKLMSMYKFDDHSYAKDSGRSIILLPDKFDILDEFYFGYWDNVSVDMMYVHINLNKYIAEIDSNQDVVVYNGCIDIEWSYFTYNEKHILLYFLPGTGRFTTNLEHIIEDGLGTYNCVAVPVPYISSFLEKHTDICSEFHLHIIDGK